MPSSTDDNIELIELNSPSSTKSYIKSKLKVCENKVGSPSTSSPAHTTNKHGIRKPPQPKPRLPPVPAKRAKRKVSKSATSGSQDTMDGFREKHSDDFTDSVLSSRSDTRSYREKFRERFESVKKQAGKSVTKAHKSHHFKGKAQNLKRSINLMRKENEEIEAELRDYMKNKSASSDGEKEGVSKAQAYSFFCDQVQYASDQEDEGSTNHLHDMGKSTEVLITVPNIDENDSVAQYLPPENLRFNVKVSENELFWKPSSKSLTVTEKLDQDEPRCLSEEGFYTEPPPNVPGSHLNILEQRLLSINDKKWFDCEGKLDLLPNPYTKTPYRPLFHHRNNPQLRTEYVPPTIGETINETAISSTPSILDISIAALKFNHHPLFSPEHVFEQRLIKFYDLYRSKLTGNKLERTGKRLDALRAIRNSMVEKGDPNHPKLLHHNNEIKKLRELHFEEGKQGRTITRAILDTWKIVKRIRQANNYSNTAVKLTIWREKRGYEEEEGEWRSRIRETCDEVISELELEYQAKMRAYKRATEQRRLQDEDGMEENVARRPKRPVRDDMDREGVLQEVTERFGESFRPPGEPILHFGLSHDNEITERVAENGSREKLRRSTVGTTKIHLRILCNRIEVCKSKPTPLNDKFAVFFDESVSIQVLEAPENIVIEVHEQPGGALLKRKLGELKLKVPPKTVYTKHNRVREEEFEKDELIHYKHEGVGSGNRLGDVLPGVKSDGEEVLNTAAVVTYKIGWDMGCGGGGGAHHDLGESTRPDVEEGVLNDEGTIDVNKLNDWIRENNPDPQDPKNSVLYEYIKSYDTDFEMLQNSTKKYFRLNPHMQPFEFCEPKEIEDNLRFKMLELRDRNEPEFVGTVVQNRIKEIPLNILDDYAERVRRESRASLSENDDEYDDNGEIDTKRSYGRKRLKQVYIKVFQQCRSTENNLVYEDVVNEKIIPHIELMVRNVISNILNWIQFQPTVNVLRMPAPRKPSTRAEGNSGSVKVVINVKSALNIPKRNSEEDSTFSRTNTNSSSRRGSDFCIKHFVEVAYQNLRLETSNVEGANPIWNDERIISLESTNTDYLSPNALSGSITVKLFDEIVEKTKREEFGVRNWLGSIEIPISAIAYNNKMEGMFKLQKPSLLIGYDQVPINASTSSRMNNQQNETHDTYLSLSITLYPNIPKLSHNMNELDTTELPHLKQYILKWNEQFNNEYPHRKFSTLTIDINGKTTCVTRYIKALEPPQLNSDRFVVSANQCAQYVSTIPFTDVNKFYQNVWLTTEQLLKFMVGSVIDHAIALTCYLTSLYMEVWLLLGYGLPQGSTGYVLLREHNRESQVPLHFIYDVPTGAKYDITDTLCPLQKVYCVINEHNVWANTQRTDQVQLTRFDFNRRSDWLPLFNNQTPAPTNSIQQKLVYSTAPDVQQLEVQINRKVRKKITKLRKHSRTVWNHHLSRVFKNEMARFETDRMYERRGSEMVLDLNDFTLSHFVNGFLLNLPYTSISMIVTAVLATGIHLHEGPDIEFSMAVQVFSYANHVLSVWICLASALRR